ncbi:hypothetical protein F4678DRAFT_464343 [Xylaria arbuscula]|nr:hypothetical protein F4678DRAFT_464343 [Xylaria arbuscula]
MPEYHDGGKQSEKYDHYNGSRQVESMSRRLSDTMSKPREVQSRCHEGSAIDTQQSSLSTNRAPSRDNKYEEYRHKANSDERPSYGSREPNDRRHQQQPQRASPAPPDEHIKPFTDSQAQQLSTTLDFEKTKLSPRKYMHRKGGISALSNASSTGNNIAEEPSDLNLQSDCASVLTKAVRQRYGKEAWNKGSRNFDYGIE